MILLFHKELGSECFSGPSHLSLLLYRLAPPGPEVRPTKDTSLLEVVYPIVSWLEQHGQLGS